jgi:putative ABC transport system permease protein
MDWKASRFKNEGGSVVNILGDLRYVLRTARTNAISVSIMVFVLALGFGGNVAIFSIVNTVLLSPLPYDHSEQLAALNETYPQGAGSASFPNFSDWRSQSRSFQSMAAYRFSSMNLQTASTPVHVSVLESDGGLFNVFRAKALLGRTFTEFEERPDGPNVVILSASIWKTAFGGDPNVIGRSVNLGPTSYEVIGVMPPEFEFGEGVWIPLHSDQETAARRSMHSLSVIGRLRDGVHLAEAQAEMNTIAGRLAQEFPDSQTGRGIRVRLMNDLTGNPVRPRILVLFASVGVVLLIACANVVGLQLAKAAKYSHETSLRVALGAGRGRIIQQFLLDASLIVLAGAALGLVLAYPGLHLLLTTAFSNQPRAAEIAINPRAGLALLLASAVCAVVVGIAPGLKSTWRAADIHALALGSGNRRTSKSRTFLIVGELAATYILVAAAALFLRTLGKLQQVDSGLAPEHVLTMQISAAGTQYQPSNISTGLLQPVLQRISSLPGVESAGLITGLPLRDWGMNGGFEIPGHPASQPGAEPSAELRATSAGYYPAMGIKLLRGRFFSESDTATSAKVAIINDVLASRYFPGEDPIGRQLIFDEPATIIGVVRANVQSRLADKPLPEVDRPYSQYPEHLTQVNLSLVVRSTVAAPTLASEIKNAVRKVDLSQSVFHIKTMDQVIAESLTNEKLNFTLLAAFGLGALLLSAIGLFGLMSHSVTERTREIGVRMALGASRGIVLRSILRNAGLLLVAGIGIGVVGALIAGRFLRGLLFGVASSDFATLATVALVLTFTGLCAAYFPARRAADLEPTIALRQ